MNDLEAYDYLNSRFIAFADEQQRPIYPVLGRKKGVADGLSGTAYQEVLAGRWFSISHDSRDKGSIDAQWNGLEPAHMQIFADLPAYDFELFWQLRCAWSTLTSA